MTASPLGRFVRRLAAPAEPDGELVRRFAETRCEAAFAELVRRYGPAVYGVCRRAIGDHHLAEDAFQAVFVVLARKAHAVRPPGAVGGWLYGVARKAAAEAAAMHRRKRRERLPGDFPDRPATVPEPDDTAAAVDAEIAALPAVLRSAVLVCEIEGVPRAKAAVRLGVAEGTLSSRLARARKLLAERLRRRGVVAPAVGGVAAVPASLAAAASRADGRAAGAVLELANGVLRTMLVSNLRLTPMAVLFLALIAGGVLAAAQETPAAARPARRAAAPLPARPPAWAVVLTLGHTSAVSGVAVGRETIATFEAGRPQPRPRLWSPADGTELGLDVRGAWFPDMPARILRFTKDDTYLVIINQYELKGAPTAAATRYRRRPDAMVGDSIDTHDVVAFSADLGTVVRRELAGPGRPARPDRLWLHDDPWADPKNVLNHKAVLDYPGGRAVTHADLSADGRVLAVAGDDSRVRLYDPAPLRERRAIPLAAGTRLTAMRLSDDGTRLAAVGEAGFARVYDTATGAELCDLRGHAGPVAAVAFAPDGKRVATAAGRVARVFDARTGKGGGELAGHAGDVTALAFSPDGEQIVTGSADKTAKVWGLKN